MRELSLIEIAAVSGGMPEVELSLAMPEVELLMPEVELLMPEVEL